MTTVRTAPATQHSKAHPLRRVARSTQSVRPSKVSAEAGKPFSLAQELEPFGTWVGEPLWVPPRDLSVEFAKSMLERHGLFASKQTCWSSIVDEHRATFQQVREIDLCKASIRLPKGKLFVSVTEQDRFHEITDVIPNCVKTRLEEFLDGPGKQPGVKVYYLKPLCVELGDDLIFTTQASVQAAIELVQREVFAAYRRMYVSHRPVRSLRNAADYALRLPRKILMDYHQRKQRALDAYQARLEFNRRKTALRACRVHKRIRTDGCTYDEMLALTNPLEREDVIEQYAVEKQLSEAELKRLKMAALQSIPWFVALSMGISYATTLAATISINIAPPMMVCDPAFVAEMPGSGRVVLKIGHFDEVRGVTHVEI